MKPLIYDADTRTSFRSGDVIALTHDQWGSWYDLQVQAVRLFTQSEYAHVALVWVFGGRVWVIESVTPVVRLVPLSLLAQEGFYHLPIGIDMTQKEEGFALSRVGVGHYSKLQAMEAQLEQLDIGADDLWECAEFVIACRRISGVDLGNKATPSALVRAAQALGVELRYFNKSGGAVL